jgi:hypothetical protein
MKHLFNKLNNKSSKGKINPMKLLKNFFGMKYEIRRSKDIGF